MILPQFRQFGAVSNKGWMEALQVHFLLSFDKVGLVDSSRAAIDAVKSATLEVVVAEGPPFCGVELPDCGSECDGCAGFFDCLDRTFANPKSDIKFPDAEGGNLLDLGAGEASREVTLD